MIISSIFTTCQLQGVVPRYSVTVTKKTNTVGLTQQVTETVVPLLVDDQSPTKKTTEIEKTNLLPKNYVRFVGFSRTESNPIAALSFVATSRLQDLLHCQFQDQSRLSLKCQCQPIWFADADPTNAQYRMPMPNANINTKNANAWNANPYDRIIHASMTYLMQRKKKKTTRNRERVAVANIMAIQRSKIIGHNPYHFVPLTYFFRITGPFFV